MGEVVSDILVYNSITNTIGDENLDARGPFSLIEFLNYSGSLDKSKEELELYNSYLRKWQGVTNIRLKDINADIKTQFTAFLSEVKLLYSSAEEKRYLDNISLGNEEQLSIAIPFFARKIKEISKYFNKKRQELNKNIQSVKAKGSTYGLVESIKDELLDIYSGDDAVQGLTIPDNIGSFIDKLSVEIENKYDTFNDYYDLDPLKSPTFYDTASGSRFDYFTSNVNEISGAFFYDTEQSIKNILNTQGVVLKEIPGFLVDFDNTDIASLPNEYFQDYQNTDTTNLKYLLQAELVQKFMGTDMYYISSNSTNEILSGKMFEAKAPYRNLLNINNPGAIQTPGNDFKSAREVGGFFKPTKHGMLKIDAEFEPILDRRTIEPETVYIFPDPARYGKISGVGGAKRETPFMFVLKNTEFKNSSSAYGKSLVKSNSDNQNFYSYSSLEQDNFTNNNETPLTNIGAKELSGNILKEVGDIYGNIFYLIDPTTIANRNVEGFEASRTIMDISPTEYISLTADTKQSISTKRNKIKNILLYNTLRGDYQPIENALSGIFTKYLYNQEIYNELNTSIIDLDIFKNTFYIRTPNYLIIDNIVYNNDGTFASKIFVSRVKRAEPNIVTRQNKTQISNFSNPVRIGNEIFTVKVSSAETTSPTNVRTFNFSIFKYNINTRSEVSIIDENTTNRSYFVNNFTFNTGTNITQVKDVKLSFNKKQNKFFLLTDLSDLNNTDNFHALVFEISGNKLTIHTNHIIVPDNNNTTSNFYKSTEFIDNYITQSLSSTPTQTLLNGTLNF